MIVALLALFIASSGGAYAVATIGAGTVGTKQLKNNAVISKKIKDGTVTTADLAASSVGSAQVADGSLQRSDFKAGELAVSGLGITAHVASATTVPSPSDPTNGPFTFLTVPGLPAGSYVATASFGIANANIVTVTYTCEVLAGATVVGTTSVEVTNTKRENGSLAVAYTATAPHALTVRCSGANAAAGTTVIDHPQVVVTPVSSVVVAP